MKLSKEREELKNLSADELHSKLTTLRRELFDLNFNASTTHVKDYSQYKKLRRSVARVITYINNSKDA